MSNQLIDPRILSTVRETESLLEELTFRKCLEFDLYYLRNGTCTVDEQDKDNPLKPWPTWSYFDYLFYELGLPPAVKGISNITVLWKSRTMMGSWSVSGKAFHMMATRPHTRVVVQSKDEKRAVKIVEYCKYLYLNSLPRLQRHWACSRDPWDQAYSKFEIDNGSSIEAFASGPDSMRFEHGTIYIFDEAAMEDQLLECVSNAQAAKFPYIWLVSSARTGPLNDTFKKSRQIPWPVNRAFYRDVEHVGESTPLSAEVANSLTLPSQTTPMRGLSKYQSPTGWTFLRVHYSCDPSMRDPVRMAMARAQFPSDTLWRREMEIEAEALGGALVYPRYSRSIHLIPDRDIPTYGCIYMSIDPHPRVEHAILWCVVDRDGDLYFYREYWPSVLYGTGEIATDETPRAGLMVRDYCIKIAELEGNQLVIRDPGTPDEYGDYIDKDGGERVTNRLMDQAGKAFKVTAEGQQEISIAQRYRNYGIYAGDPIKSHQVGQDIIDGLLTPAPHSLHGSWPRMHIAESLVELDSEFSNHRFSPTIVSPSRDLNQRPSGFRTHELDNCRYISCSQPSYMEAFASPVIRNCDR